MRFRARARRLSRIMPLSLAGSRFVSLLFICASLILLIFSSHNPYSLQTIRTTVADVAAPVISIVNAPIQKAADYTRDISGLASLQEENLRLAEENMKLREWYQTALVLKSENEALQDLLNIKLEPHHKFVTARVVSDTTSSYVKTLLVMAGEKHEVSKGQAALAAEGLIGRVVEVGHSSARILLLTDINSRVPVFIEGVDWKAILAGNNTDYPVLAHLPPEAELTEGARVMTSGHGGMFPYGLPIGTIHQSEAGKWRVAPYIKATDTTFVRLIDSSADPNLKSAR